MPASPRRATRNILDGEPPESPVSEVSLPDILRPEFLESLRWYVEDYLRAPYGVYEDNAAKVEASLRGWGEALFSTLFGSGPSRDAYTKLRDRKDVDVLFRSEPPGLLALPWELLADP